jgi:YidC/Oxa1 family membrane protein insertase
MILQLSTLAAAANTCPPAKESGGGVFGPIAKPLAAVLAGIYHVVPSYGVAILVLSVAWMVIISPLTLKSTRSMLAMQKIQPEIKRLQEKHKNDRQAFAQAQMDLFKERGVSPFGSCLPTLLPLPVFFALFRLLDGLSNKTHGCPTPQFLSPNTKMYHDIVAGGGTLHSFGLNLSQNALSHHSSFLAAVPFFILLLIMGGTQYLQTQQMMSRNPAAADNPQMKMMKYLPIIFTVICIRFPAGVVLYYSMSNLCRIAQQSLMYRFDPKVRTLAAKEVIDVESYTKEHEAEHARERAQGKSRDRSPAVRGKGDAAEEEPKPARSRFSALFEAAKEQKARDLERRSEAKTEGKGQPASRPANAKKAGGGAGGGPAKAGGAKAGGGRAGGPKQPSGGRSGGGGGGSGAKPRPASSPRPKADRSSGNGGGDNGGGANGGGSNGAVKANGTAAKTTQGGRTGAANRTGARSGGGKKRRGR